jgi:membrane-associated phospholipid phosphatase
LLSFAIIATLVLLEEKTNFSYFQFDKILFSIRSHNIPILDNLMVISTLYGREIFWVLMIVMLILLGGNDGRKTALILVLSIIVITLVNSILKDLLQRPRPEIPSDKRLVAQDKEFSFPSGHASIVSGCAITTAVLFSNTTKRKIIVCLVILEAALVCLSRIYVGVHYPSDVLGGILLGTGISLGIIEIREPIYRSVGAIWKIMKKN